MTKKPNMALYVKLQTPNGEEYIIDRNEEVFGPSFITRQRILYHMLLVYKENKGFIFLGYEREFKAQNWIKVIGSKTISEREEQQALNGEIVY